jgi:hypothetical protein
MYGYSFKGSSSNDNKNVGVIVTIILTMLLKLYIGLVGISAVRELVTIFMI